MAKKKSKEKSKKGKKTPTPDLPEVPVIRPNAFELIRRKLKREKTAREAAWILYPDAPTYTKELGVDEPKPKKGKKAGTPLQETKSTIPRVVSEMRSKILTPVSDGDDPNKRKVILFNLNMKEYDCKPEEEAWVQGEHLGDTDNESEGSIKQYITDIKSLTAYREMYMAPHKRKSQVGSKDIGAKASEVKTSLGTGARKESRTTGNLALPKLTE